jgi:hypothetical protein
MKHKILIIISILSLSFSSEAQFGLPKLMQKPAATEGGNSTGDAMALIDGKNRIRLRGPVKPIDGSYGNYKTFSIKLNISSDFESSIKSRNIPYSLSDLTAPLNIFGLKKVEDGDFKISYNLKRYELVKDEDYIENTYQNAPAYYIGLESNLEIQNREGKVVYSRHTTPKVRMFVSDPGYGYERLAYRIVREDFLGLLDEFETYYLNSPNVNLEYFEVKKKKKSKSTFNVEEFNQSAQVFAALIDVDRENWGGLFGEAQKYWKPLAEFTDDDEDLQKDVRFAANYNLSCASILLDKMDELETTLPKVKENEKGFLGIRLNYDELNRTQKSIAEAKTIVDQVSKIEPIEAEPIIFDYKKGQNAFRFAEFEGGEAVDQDNNSIKGKVRIMSDYPEIVDYRTVQTKSALGQLANQMGSDKSSVRIFVEGEKKPKKANLKKLIFIKDKTGRMYITGKTGGAMSGQSSGRNLVNTKRYALFDEIKTTKKLALYQEFFPQDSYVLKRPTEEEFYSPPGLIGRKKSLREYFADCPVMIEKINKGEYDFNNKDTFVKMFNDYEAAGCGK